MSAADKRIVILGGGHAGFHAARRLLKRRRSADRLEIVLVSSENAETYHGFMPQIVGGKIEPRHALIALRHVLPGVKLYIHDVERIDPHGRRVYLNPGEEQPLVELTYDYLVLALGSVTDVSRFPGLLEHGLQTKTIGDVFYLRDHVIAMLERASAEPDGNERRRLLTFVIAGAGFAGVEIGSEANQLVRAALRYYPAIQRGDVRFLIITSSERILPAVSEMMSRRAAAYLARTGVEVRLGVNIAGATAGAALLSTGERIETRTLIVTVGVKPNPVLSALPFEFDKGRVQTDRMCRVAGQPGIYAIGDNAAVPHPKAAGPCPPTAIYAFQQGNCAADNIIAEHRGKQARPFTFTSFGELAALSNTWGVVELFGITISGLAGSLLWRLIFLSIVPTWSRRWTILFDWFASMVLPADIAQVKMNRSDAIVPLRFAAGQTIIRENEPAGRFYMINDGEVEVVRRRSDGGEDRLAQLGPGEYFGESALLHDIVRTATVRALTDARVFGIARQDFQTLVKHLPRLRETVVERANISRDV